MILLRVAPTGITEWHAELEARALVEGTLGWINRARRLAKDFAAKIDSSLAWLPSALAFLLIRRLARFWIHSTPEFRGFLILSDCDRVFVPRRLVSCNRTTDQKNRSGMRTISPGFIVTRLFRETLTSLSVPARRI